MGKMKNLFMDKLAEECADPHYGATRSNCCCAPFIGETDLCSSCKEHADTLDNEEE